MLSDEFKESTHVVIKLCPISIKLRDAIAFGRQSANEANNVAENGKGRQTSIEKHIEGASGEVAAWRYLGGHLNISLELQTKATGKDPGDVIVQNAGAIDVKTSTYPHARLIVSAVRPGNGDVFLLAIYCKEGEEVRLVGWMGREELLQPENLSEMRGRAIYIIPQDKLRPMEELLERTRHCGCVVH